MSYIGNKNTIEQSGLWFPVTLEASNQPGSSILVPVSVQATPSGTYTDSTISAEGQSFRVLKWTGTGWAGSLDVTAGGVIELLMVAGGGAGGADHGGGGGAGGLIHRQTFALGVGSHSFYIGGGGSGNSTSGMAGKGNNGVNTVAFGLTAVKGSGGGYGGGGATTDTRSARDAIAGSSGGMGAGMSAWVGGNGLTMPAFQSFYGGYGNVGVRGSLDNATNNSALFGGGGGGGAGTPGLDYNGTYGWRGGNGLELDIEGSLNTYAAGGQGGGAFAGFAASGIGGKTQSGSNVGTDGAAATGSGGGGGSSGGTTRGGAGGSGVVIVRYAI